MEPLHFSLKDLPPAWEEHIWPLVRDTTSPPYYLVGGAITRTLINQIYGTILPITNYDFAVGSLSTEPQLQNGWVIRVNSFGNWKVVSDELNIHVDVWPFADWKRSRGAVETLEEALAAVPIDVQAVGYDVLTEKLSYHPAFALALQERCVRTLCHDEHAYRLGILKLTREQDLKYRAERFGFKYEL